MKYQEYLEEEVRGILHKFLNDPDTDFDYPWIIKCTGTPRPPLEERKDQTDYLDLSFPTAFWDRLGESCPEAQDRFYFLIGEMRFISRRENRKKNAVFIHIHPDKIEFEYLDTPMDTLLQ